MEGRSISGSTMVAVLLFSLTMGVFGAERVNKSAAVGSWSPEADEDLGDRTVQEEERHLDGGFSSLDGMLQWAIGHSDPAKLKEATLSVQRLSQEELKQRQIEIKKIHQLLMSLSFTAIEIKTINSLESWSGGVLVVVSGSVKSRDFNSSRKFVQTFFLAPQEKGYFVLNDAFHFAGEEVVHQPPAPVTAQEQSVDYHPTIASHLPNPPVSDYALEEEEVEYVNSVDTEGDEPVQEYSYREHLQQEPEPESEPEPEPETEAEEEIERLEEETPFEDSRTLLNTVTTVQEPQLSVDEPVGEPEKLTYASILRAKGKSPSSISVQPVLAQRPPAADWNYVSQPLPHQSIPNLPNPGVDSVEETLPLQEGESKSVYVRNLPSTVTSPDIMQEFENFGRIKHDGVFLRNRMDTGVCYAFVEFEDVQSVWNAIKASPIQLAGRKVYIEERRPNSSASRGGRGGGRGRGGRGGRNSGR